MACPSWATAVALLFLGMLKTHLVSAQSLPTPVICEDTIDGSPPFNSNNVPCLLGCGTPLTHATASLLPGSVNETDIPYCQLNCVHKSATPAESAAAPGCYQACKAHNQATPENIGWCMYWCVDGFQEVASTSCVPSLRYGSTITTVIGDQTVTVAPFTEPAEWQSWYATQTVLSRASDQAKQTSSSSPATTAQSVGIASGTSSSTAAPILSTMTFTSNGRVITAVTTEAPALETQNTGTPVSSTTTGEGSRLRITLVVASLVIWCSLVSVM
ncbi:hypothetical protein GQ53DRAFT_754728 [Thozetella sp. PMI_491]|nr:hypothetical protein GQ53DRAFT_754728 [Thozetella sp. PMI_491]